MVSPLYAVSALTYAVVLAVILIYDIQRNKETGREEKAFRLLIAWVILFCLQDLVWGLCGSGIIPGNGVFFLSSTVFHASTVITTFFWLNYVLVYVMRDFRRGWVLLLLDGFIVLFQLVLLCINLFRPTIFYIENGIYYTAHLRPQAFMNQYMVYLISGAVALLYAITHKGEDRKRYTTVFLFAFAPILSGVFQLLYPDGPFYSMGYFLGCFMIHIFVVSRDREMILLKQHNIELRHSEEMIAQQIAISVTDELTGLFNRHAYEDDLRAFGAGPLPEKFVYISADVNGLKNVNDTLGHGAGDELLRGAADCMRRYFSPYGKVYRMGGDEFAAMIEADEDALKAIQTGLNECIRAWHGEIVKELAIAFGYLRRCEVPDMPLLEMVKTADIRMYRAKTEYYYSRGIDREGQYTAYVALCESCTKILKVNLTENSYHIIRMDESEQTPEKGYAEKISVWLHDFAVTGQVHEVDREEFLRKSDICYLRAHFASGKQYLSVFYRRLMKDGYRQTIMEMIPAEDYRSDRQSVYLYVRKIES